MKKLINKLFEWLGYVPKGSDNNITQRQIINAICDCRSDRIDWTQVFQQDDFLSQSKDVKLLKIYDTLYDLYVDDSDCTKCQSFTYCMMHGVECLYHEDFELNDYDKDFLTKKAHEIYEIATK